MRQHWSYYPSTCFTFHLILVFNITWVLKSCATVAINIFIFLTHFTGSLHSTKSKCSLHVHWYTMFIDKLDYVDHTDSTKNFLHDKSIRFVSLFRFIQINCPDSIWSKVSHTNCLLLFIIYETQISIEGITIVLSFRWLIFRKQICQNSTLTFHFNFLGDTLTCNRLIGFIVPLTAWQFSLQVWLFCQHDGPLVLWFSPRSYILILVW